MEKRGDSQHDKINDIYKAIKDYVDNAGYDRSERIFSISNTH